MIKKKKQKTKPLHKLGIEGPNFNIIEAIYNKCTGNIILNGEKLQAFPLRSGTKQGFPLHHFYSTQFWKSQLWKAEQRKKEKEIQTGKKDVKLSSHLPMI